MLEITVGYRTLKTISGSTGKLLTPNDISLDVRGEVFSRDAIPLFYPKEDLHLLCSDCKGMSGGCPPYAPYFEQIKPSSRWFYVITVRLDMAWAIARAGPNEYFKFSYADRLTMYYLDRIMRQFSQMRQTLYLGAGGCNACGAGKNCTVVKGESCVKPDRRVYSMEATGVDCSELHNTIYGHRLPYWYYDGALPHYMVRYGGAFLKDQDDADVNLLMAIKADQSYIPYEPQLPSFRLVKRRAPGRVMADAGLEYWGYELLEDGSYAECIE